MDFWFTENIVGDGTLLINKTIGIEWDLKRETWCHFGKAWCHFVWFDWLACLPFFFSFFFFFGWLFLLVCVCVCRRMFAVVLCFYSWGLCSLCISLRAYSSCKDVLFFLNTPIFVLTPPSSLPFLLPLRPPPTRQRAAFAKAVIHAFLRKKQQPQTCRKFSTPASSLKSPPTSYPPCRRPRASDTSQMSIGNCTGPCKWRDISDARRDSIELYWIHP